MIRIYQLEALRNESIRELSPILTHYIFSHMNEVWVFHGAGSRFTGGVFTSRQQAEEFIQQYQLSGILTKYPLGISIYDWAQQQGFFQPTKPEQYTTGFIQRFSSASQEHYHYEDGKHDS